MSLFADIYRERRVLVTGHTGFKGSWLALWLAELGADVAGYALSSDASPNHWDLLGLDCPDTRADVRDLAGLQACMETHQPEVVFHLAAQPLVRRSYREPLETWSSNVMGTANVLEACRQAPSVKAIVAVTTDKVYRNEERQRGYREDDRLGGHDPYSASKAACELAIDSYRKAFFQGEPAKLLASARAGNVVGGGDWSEDRLIPDLVRAMSAGAPLLIRSPHATRPWQHVLDCLSGYLQLGQRLLQGDARFADAWNFGPAASDNRSVLDVLQMMRESWPEMVWQQGDAPRLHEAGLLYLDSSRAHSELAWQPVWTLPEALHFTADWYRQHVAGSSPPSRAQLQSYLSAARSRNVSWAGG